MPSFASVVQPRLRRKWERMQAEPFLTALYFRLCPLSSAISASGRRRAMLCAGAGLQASGFESRYYWPQVSVQKELDPLMVNLSAAEIPLALLRQYLPQQYEAVRECDLPKPSPKPG
ncbi:MAG: hypothetical protein DMG69_02340 [Acidobacteria bacterium]|nr:MAG: hypothetical protein DMG69_02340 [Acidobacteriota bacterium]